MVPIHVAGPYSRLFHLFDKVSQELRDVTLFHEVLNKAGQQSQVTIGAPVAAKSRPVKSDEAIEMLRRIVLALPEPADTRPVSTSRLVKRRIIKHI